MKHVRVVFDANGREAEVHPMYDVLANAPFVERATALQWNVTDDALGILHYVEGDVDAFDAAVAVVDAVVDYDLEPAGERAFYAYIVDAATGPVRDLFGAFARDGVVVVPPIVYREDGRVALSVFGPAGALGETVDAVGSLVEVTVLEVGGLTGVAAAVETGLSARQREALEVGLDLGYFDVPRTASQADVADALGCSPSTAAEHLRKGEATVLRSVLGT